jgi:hypothetical protein
MCDRLRKTHPLAHALAIGAYFQMCRLEQFDTVQRFPGHILSGFRGVTMNSQERLDKLKAGQSSGERIKL